MLTALRNASPSGEFIVSMMQDIMKQDRPQRITLWSELGTALETDNAQYIRFRGDKESFVGLSSGMAGCTRGFTVNLWMRIDESAPPKGFLLFRCRCAEGGEDAILSERQADGTWTITVRSYTDRLGAGSSERHEFGSTISLLRGWNLISFVHDNAEDTCNVLVHVNGTQQLTHPLPYPLSGQHSPCQWAVCLGLQGAVSSVSLFEGPMHSQLLQLLHSLGPQLRNVAAAGVATPQSSFDSGFVSLGSRCTKGQLAAELYRWPCEFFVTAVHFAGDGLPAVTTGRIGSSDNIDMAPLSLSVQQSDSSFSPTLSSGCSLAMAQSWSLAWLDAGGSPMVLWMIWYICNGGDGAVGAQDVDEVLTLFKLLELLFGASGDHREQFIQSHGFHVLGACLAVMNQNYSILNAALVDALKGLVEALGADGVKGDGCAAALQGIFLNFGVWGEADLSTKAKLLATVCSLSLTVGEEMQRCFGMQQLLDGLRLFFLKDEVAGSADVQLLSLSHQLAEAAHSLLLVSFDATIDAAQRVFSRVMVPRDIDAILSCAEEASSQPLLEVMFRLLDHARRLVPIELLECLTLARFAETSAIELLSRQDLSAGLRKSVLLMSLWCQSSPLQEVLKMLFTLHRKQRALLLEIEADRRGGDSKALLQISSDIAATVKPIEKGWTNMVMLSELVEHNIANGLWDTSEPGSVGGRVSVVNEILSMFFDDGPYNSRFDVWLALPLLPTFLAECDLEVFQRVMMSVVVSLKTDDAQIETVCSLPHSYWLSVVLDICLTGDLVCCRPDVLTDPASPAPEAAPGNEGGWEMVQSVNVRSRASTCRELTLDALATLLEFQMRMRPSEAWNCWLCLQSLLQTRRLRHVEETIARQCSIDIVRSARRQDILQRLVSLVLQRLARCETWLSSMLPPLNRLISLAENKLLDCKGLNDIAKQRLATQTLLDIEEVGAAEVVSEDRLQTLYFLIDCLTAVRKTDFRGLETELLLNGLRIVLCFMHFASEKSVDRIANEVLSQLQSLLYASSAAVSAERFKEILLSIFHCAKSAIALADGGLVKDRLVVMVFTLCHQFIEVRHCLAAGQKFADHVIPAVDAMMGIDTCVDVELVFRLVDINLFSAGSISFEELPEPEIDMDFLNVNSRLSDGGPVSLLDGDNVSVAVGSAVGTDVAQESDRPTDQLALIADDLYNSWVVTRHGIVLERLDSERMRLKKVARSTELASEAIDKYWRKLRRKLESECLQQPRACQWKLCVAHEGPFPGRRRVVLRPQFDVSDAANSCSDASELGLSLLASSGSEDDVKRAVATALAGQIKDVRNNDAVNADEGVSLHPSAAATTGSEAEYGADWGVVGADGSDEGFGVIGLAVANEPAAVTLEDADNMAAQRTGTGKSGKTKASASRSEVTSISDHKLVDEAMRKNKLLDTGPSYSGTRRPHHSQTVTARVILVTASGNHSGYLYLSRKELCFASSGPATDHGTDAVAVNVQAAGKIRRRRWAVAHISAVYLRRFRLRETAMEVFFKKGKHKHFFVDFGHTPDNKRARNEFARAVMSAAPSTAFKQWQMLSPFRLVSEHGVQEKWLNREISNFEYLMALNTISGRSFNDLCQYPVMPWVLAQFTEPTIDLQDASVYRDLSKPMGALNETRLRDFLDRYESFSECVTMDIPPFMYGSHYSTMVGVVLHFLVRLQPFASLHKEMQNGRFDVSDRLFSSAPRTFIQNTTQLSEVKELTPEWFTTPEMFRNLNRFDLGHTQDGLPVDDVELPPWAATPEEFVRIHRDALESDYVSAHLHEWIDLIFGYKQRGPAAVEACNVFYYLTYAGSVNRDLIKDDALRKATELQIAHFGQIPLQLFKAPHPARKPVAQCSALPGQLTRSANALRTREKTPNMCDEDRLAQLSLSSLVCRRNKYQSSLANLQNTACGNILAIEIGNSKILCVLDSGVIEFYRYSTSDAAKAALAAASKAKSDNNGAPAARSRPADLISFDDEPPADCDASSAALKKFVGEFGVVVDVKKATFHFEVLPRAPLRKTVSISAGIDSDPAAGRIPLAVSAVEAACSLVRVTCNRRLLLTAGHSDGSICIRQIDSRVGSVVACADFVAHQRRVVALAVDTITSTEAVVAASADAHGQLMVWTIFQNQSQSQAGSLFGISRRPQRLFRCAAAGDVSVDISWSMGVVVAAHDMCMSLFSMERDELIRSIDLKQIFLVIDNRGNSTERPWPSTSMHCPNAVAADRRWHQSRLRRVALSNDGYIVAEVRAVDETGPEASFIVSLSLAGFMVGCFECSAAVTFMECPMKGPHVVIGTAAGEVLLLQTDNLRQVLSLFPHESCRVLSSPAASNNNSTANEKMAPSEGTSTAPSAILSVKLGPDPSHPAILCFSTCNGELFVQPFPEFIRWEKTRSPSALAQFVSVPLQAVRGTIQQAQNLGAWTSEQAESLAQNARSLADDALDGLKKINRNSILKGVGSLFGLRK